ncbi:N-6 DNA methylase [Nocardiopsis exhalans]|uniref:site-specific DNA-methyltransferase (adenine-specific) n=2 Tax=Nocardiopsis TaxID=2013 RepID=A0A840WEL2_9ACTN|nr:MULTISPECIES: type ISP restriction/modification enzyme [Nocardiopsis]MBB5491451.1 hypothetical protein [Nocardiopsis metallicus]USY17999.1 N-6 DNA methylase [Nocardiopsis exhalans]
MGAGIPDGGLFAAHQLRRAGGSGAAFERQLPTHGAVEAKPLETDLNKIASSAQAKKYLRRYGKLLLTNFHEFALWEQTAEGPQRRETFTLASSAEELQQLERRKDFPDVAASLHSYLNRVLMVGAPITRAEDLAFFLAAYARQALDRIDKGDLRALNPLRKALGEALGLTFQGEEQDRFFRSTLVQTLFYGIFSAWVFWSEQPRDGTERFDWRTASWLLNVPVVRALFDQVSNASRLRPLHLGEVLDWAGDALNRVDRQAFFATFESSDAVLYFYEPFLAEFDPNLRRELGIWYTPREVVSYMVERVDTMLRQEMDCPDGLADERVYVLDPCAGTGSFLLEVLRRIHRTLSETTGDALAGHDVREAALKRIIGFEILPAPFVVAHLQIGMYLRTLGAPLDTETEQRAAVYLTNALTGWLKGAEQPQLGFPELVAERDAASEVKQKSPILVVLGNPPYNAYAGVSPEEEGGLVDVYKEGLASWGVKRSNIDDLYIRFLRLAERRITEAQGEGVVCLISNFSYLNDPSLVLVRKRLLQEFNCLWIDNLNGDARETGKKTPDGQSDPSVFATNHNRSGISVGTAISTFVRRRSQQDQASVVLYRDFWGSEKKSDLYRSLTTDQPAYAPLVPLQDTAYTLRPQNLHPDYFTWARVDELAEAAPMPGLLEKRGGTLIDSDPQALEGRMRRYLDPAVKTEDLGQDLEGLAHPWARFNPEKTRAALIAKGGYDPHHLRPYLVRPYEYQWAYTDPKRPLWNEPRPELQNMAEEGSEFFLARRRVPRALDGAAFYYSPSIGDDHALHKNAYYIPTRLAGEREDPNGQTSIFDTGQEARANLSTRAREWLAAIGAGDPDVDVTVGEMPWLHALAIGFSPAYLSENCDGGGFHYQRVPLPADAALLRTGAALGRQIAGLLTTDTPLSSLVGDSGQHLRGLGAITSTHDTPLSHESLRLVSWASIQANKVLPANGRTSSRSWTAKEHDHLQALTGTLGLPPTAIERLGTAMEVHLNGDAHWSAVPSAVWGYKIGGYAVLRKWLSYRDERVLGRALTSGEVRQVTATVQRLTLLVLLEEKLDSYYRNAQDNSHEWHTKPPLTS